MAVRSTMGGADDAQSEAADGQPAQACDARGDPRELDEVEATVRRIRAMIAAGEYAPGERLGSERALAEGLGIPRSALRRALDRMEQGHEISRKIGRTGGITVADGRLERNVNTLESLPVFARRQGFAVVSHVLSATVAMASDADRRMLRLDDMFPRMERHGAGGGARGTSVYSIVRLRTVNDNPLSVELTHLPTDVFPGFLLHDLSEPFYEIFRSRYGVVADSAQETIEAVSADERLSRWLQLPEGETLIRIRRVACDADGMPCERAEEYYPAFKIRFTMRHSGYVRLSATRES